MNFPFKSYEKFAKFQSTYHDVDLGTAYYTNKV